MTPEKIARRVLAHSADLGTTLVAAQPDDFIYIDALRKREGDALGFIPKQQYMRKLLEHKHPTFHSYDYQHEFLVITKDNDDYTGFAYGRFSASKGHTSLWQIAIQEDARRWHRAMLITSWIEAEPLRRGCATVKARVAADIESNMFWRAAGYEVWGEATSTFLSRSTSKSGRVLLLYVKHLALPWQPTLEAV